jgi:hypothetical protein
MLFTIKYHTLIFIIILLIMRLVYFISIYKHMNANMLLIYFMVIYLYLNHILLFVINLVHHIFITRKHKIIKIVYHIENVVHISGHFIFGTNNNVLYTK